MRRWDYLIVTASNQAQAQAYEKQLAVRRQMHFLGGVRQTLVVADPGGQRVGSGGSTLFCLMQVVNRELAKRPALACPDFSVVQSILGRLRILIVHAGGDSRRLPAYGPCGKIFIPVPARKGSGTTLFDRLVPAFMDLPPGRDGCGQIVMAAGDALILFDASNVSFAFEGLIALCCPATPEHASKHGVFCPDAQDGVRLYLQKPGLEQQRQAGAINANGETMLDIGIMSFDAAVAVALLKCFEVAFKANGQLDWLPDAKAVIMSRGVDFYREVCCALGAEASAAHFQEQLRQSGSTWPESELGKLFQGLSGIPFHLQTVPACKFLHFGTTRQLITSGAELREYDHADIDSSAVLDLNNELLPGGAITGTSSWVEACRVSAPLKLSGQNVVAGLDVQTPLILPKGACLDVLQGKNRAGEPVWFIRCYGVGDTFKDTAGKGATFCGCPVMEWLKLAGAEPEDIWDSTIPMDQRSLWNARVFPAGQANVEFQNWLWMFEPETATAQQKKTFLLTDRYSAAEIAFLADLDVFLSRRISQP